jgi:NAD(P)-dependent dehydrogenase (short-subunit alcohol dehydrogenase family)
MPRVFLITGCSTGFGKEYVQEVLDKGDKVVATARDTSKLSFNGSTDDNYLAVKLDVTDKSSIDSAFKAALDKFGRIDVVVNNAGYGLAGCFEEYTEDQASQVDLPKAKAILTMSDPPADGDQLLRTARRDSKSHGDTARPETKRRSHPASHLHRRPKGSPVLQSLLRK